MAVERSTKRSAYVTGVVNAPNNVDESMEETPFVASAV